MEFTIIKSRAMTPSMSLQCRAFSRTVMDEKVVVPAIPIGALHGGGGGGLQMTIA